MNYNAFSFDLRKDVLDMIVAGNGGHIGGDMSVIDALMTLYFRVMNISPENIDSENRDMFVLSKGHCVEALYAVLAAKGFFSIDEVMQKFMRFGTQFIGHPNNKLPGIEMNSGSLGHGLSVCVGMALAAKMNKSHRRIYTIMGDGELAEGSIWEAAMAANHYHLDNLCAVIDRNHLQISGNTEDVMRQDSLIRRWSSFGWHTVQVKNGNDSDELYEAFIKAKKSRYKPTVIIANTVKGFGSEIMENKAEGHHRVPSHEEYDAIIIDFKARKEALINEHDR